MKKILITGGAGFIGSNLVRRLMHNSSIIVLDNLSTGKRKNLPQNKNVKFFNIDLLKKEKILKYFKNIDFVYHLAANADIRFGLNHPSKDFKQNCEVTLNVLEAMRINRIKKIAFTSTAPIYGDTKTFPTPENAPLSVQTSLYGSSKLYCEGLIESYSLGYGFVSWIFRLASVVGENYSHGHVIDFYNKLKKNDKKIKVLGNGNQKKSIIHINDFLDALDLSIKKSKKKINIFNISHNNYIKIKDSLKIIQKKLKTNAKPKFEKKRAGWIGDQELVLLDNSKIKKLGWKPKYSIKKSIQLTIESLQKTDS